MKKKVNNTLYENCIELVDNKEDLQSMLELLKIEDSDEQSCSVDINMLDSLFGG